jgi:hypothetical protein
MPKTTPKELRSQIGRSGIDKIVVDADEKNLVENFEKIGNLDRREAEAAAKAIAKKKNVWDRDKLIKKLSKEKEGWEWDSKKRDKIEHSILTGSKAKEKLFSALKDARTLDLKKSILKKMFRIDKSKRERLIKIFKNERVVSKDRQALDTSSPVVSKFMDQGVKSITARSDFSTSHSLSANQASGGSYSNVSALSGSVTNRDDLNRSAGGSASILSQGAGTAGAPASGPSGGGLKPGFINNFFSLPRGR